MPSLIDARTNLPLRVALLIPAYNEEPVIGQTLRALPARLFDQVIVAVNGSTDGTAAAARTAGAEVVEISGRGYGAACLAAMSQLRADVVVFLQADGSENAAEAGALVGPIARGEADLVIGSRTMGRAEAGSLLPHQRFGNWLSTSLIRLLYGRRYSDLGPFRAIRVDRLLAMGMKEHDYGWTIEMQIRAIEQGLRVMEVPVSYSVRRAGTNKVSGNLRASLNAGIIILRTVLVRGLRFRLASPLAVGR